MKICIIGAGPSGLSAVKAFTDLKDPTIQVICYEKQSKIGGLWNVSWQKGVDNQGEIVHSAQYQNLYSNAAAEVHEYPDYSYEKHFGQKISSYPPGFAIRDYIAGRFDSHYIKTCIKFNHTVKWVEEKTEKFTVTVYDTVNSKTFTEEFDYCIVASGRFTYPFHAEYNGIENFKGEIIHSKDFKTGSAYENKTILVTGSSYSAEDVAIQCVKYGAKHCFLGYREKHEKHPWNAVKFPAEFFTRKSDVEKITESGVIFKDKSEKCIDAIIICTGYQCTYPFMAENLRLETRNRWNVENLYENTVFIDNPRLFYMGMMNQALSVIMFDVQAAFIRTVLLDDILPSKTEMQEKSKSAQNFEESLPDYELMTMVENQFDYIKRWARISKYPYEINFDIIMQNFMEWGTNKAENVLTFRDKAHCSIYTGQRSRLLKTPYMNLQLNSINEYLSELI